MNGFFNLTAKVRKDPLGPDYLNALTGNAAWLRDILSREHIVSGSNLGEHNAIEIPRVCARVSGTTVTGDSKSYITAVAHPSAGNYTLTLKSGVFTTNMRVQVNVSNQSAKPWCPGIEIVSATSLKVHLVQLDSLLGGGNVWGANNADFDIAIHSDPLDAGTWPTDLPARCIPGMTLDSEQDISVDSTGFHWNRLVTQSADIYSALTAAHTSVGVHNVREVPKYSGWGWWDTGGSYHAVDSSGLTFTYVSTGICDVTYSALTAPVSAFVCPDYARSSGSGALGDIFLAYGFESSTTKTRVYMYKYDTAGHTWARANCDFFIAVHGS